MRRILVPIDFTDRAAASLQAAIDLARRFSPAKCLALHVDRHDTRCSAGGINPVRRKELMNAFGDLTKRIDPKGVGIEPLFIQGHHISRAIGRAADRHSADLIVMATRGRSPSAQAILPSLTESTISMHRGSFLVLKTSASSLGLSAALRERWKRGDEPHFS